MEKLKAKKSLGQNFLKDDQVLEKIVKNGNISPDDVVIEIGPGQGALTELLVEKCKKVIAIELDDRLIPVLQEKFQYDENVEIIHDDILKINLPELIVKNELQSGYKVIANIPYYITAPIIRLLLETKFPPSEIILMVQKEVAERITAKPGSMSILAVSVQYYSEARYLFTVPRAAFDPVPKVDSAIIKIVTSNQQSVTSEKKEEVKKFFRIVRAGFSAKRKTLENNLSNGLHVDKKEVLEKIESIGFVKNTRAQELSVEDWKKLVNIL
ncbi:MAG: dimethyladenosine transferase [uncultured bacterium]|nr:MAG: dimethyladenosine transferase [uncultured bacterium]